MCKGRRSFCYSLSVCSLLLCLRTSGLALCLSMPPRSQTRSCLWRCLYDLWHHAPKHAGQGQAGDADVQHLIFKSGPVSGLFGPACRIYGAAPQSAALKANLETQIASNHLAFTYGLACRISGATPQSAALKAKLETQMASSHLAEKILRCWGAGAGGGRI